MIIIMIIIIIITMITFITIIIIITITTTIIIAHDAGWNHCQSLLRVPQAPCRRALSRHRR